MSRFLDLIQGNPGKPAPAPVVEVSSSKNEEDKVKVKKEVPTAKKEVK